MPLAPVTTYWFVTPVTSQVTPGIPAVVTELNTWKVIVTVDPAVTSAGLLKINTCAVTCEGVGVTTGTGSGVAVGAGSTTCGVAIAVAAVGAAVAVTLLVEFLVALVVTFLKVTGATGAVWFMPFDITYPAMPPASSSITTASIKNLFIIIMVHIVALNRNQASH